MSVCGRYRVTKDACRLSEIIGKNTSPQGYEKHAVQLLLSSSALPGHKNVRSRGSLGGGILGLHMSSILLVRVASTHCFRGRTLFATS